MGKFYFWGDCLTFEIPGEAVRDCTRPGDNSQAVDFWVSRVSFAGASPEDIRLELVEAGAWDASELSDPEENRKRFLWIACHGVSDQKGKGGGRES